MKKTDGLERIFSDICGKNLKKQELVASYDYISWLEKFTLSHEYFADDSWAYKPDEISQSDLENVQVLDIFFGALSEFCHKYYINTAWNEMYEEERINVKYNGIGYQFGLVVGQGAYVYVKRVDVTDTAIDFADVLNDVAPVDFEAKKALLTKFKAIVDEMKSINIPLAAMLNTFME